MEDMKSGLISGRGSDRIDESTHFLKNRDKGILSNYENTQFFEAFNKELNDIETINDRVARDIERKTQHRIQKFGIDGKRILGIHIKAQ